MTCTQAGNAKRRQVCTWQLLLLFTSPVQSKGPLIAPALHLRFVDLTKPLKFILEGLGRPLAKWTGVPWLPFSCRSVVFARVAEAHFPIKMVAPMV